MFAKPAKSSSRTSNDGRLTPSRSSTRPLYPSKTVSLLGCHAITSSALKRQYFPTRYAGILSTWRECFEKDSPGVVDCLRLSLGDARGEISGERSLAHTFPGVSTKLLGCRSKRATWPFTGENTNATF